MREALASVDAKLDTNGRRQGAVTDANERQSHLAEGTTGTHHHPKAGVHANAAPLPRSSHFSNSPPSVTTDHCQSFRNFWPFVAGPDTEDEEEEEDFPTALAPTVAPSGVSHGRYYRLVPSLTAAPFHADANSF